MLNPFFLQGSKGEQGLVQDLVNEQLRMYGIECHYIPRKLMTSRTIMKEVVESRFDQAFPLEAYLMNMMDTLDQEMFSQSLVFELLMKQHL